MRPTLSVQGYGRGGYFFRGEKFGNLRWGGEGWLWVIGAGGGAGGSKKVRVWC